MMRITGGVLRGRTLIGQVPPGVRPTAAKVREALFSMIGQDLEGNSLLDAFGGMGLFAFEAFSRGAAPITIVERHRRTAEGIRAQAAHLGVPIDLRVDDARKILDSPGDPWDIVFLDPPYAEDPLPWAQRAAPRAAQLLIFEHRVDRELPTTLGPLQLDRTRLYGETAIRLYRPA